MEFLKSHWFHILLDCEDSLSGTIYLLKREKDPNIYIRILCQFKYWKYCFQLRGNIAKFTWCCNSPIHPSIIWTNQTCLPTSCFDEIVPSVQYFPNHWPMEIFFYFWDRPWYSVETVLKLNYIPYLGSQGFLIVILSKMKCFQSAALLKTPPSSTFMKEFGQ